MSLYWQAEAVSGVEVEVRAGRKLVSESQEGRRDEAIHHLTGRDHPEHEHKRHAPTSLLAAPVAHDVHWGSGQWQSSTVPRAFSPSRGRIDTGGVMV